MAADAALFVSEEFMRFDRLKAITNDFDTITNHTILIFGLGGVGSFAAEAIARSGFQRIILVDFDQVAESNINRQIIALDDTLGLFKTEVMEERIHKINPYCKVIIHTEKATEENLFIFFEEKVDYVIECIDDMAAKIAIAKEIEKRNIEMISSMGFANKFEPDKIKIAPLDKTNVCPLARRYRALSRESGLSLKREVIFSTETPSKSSNESVKLGSTAFVPSVAGLMLAAHVFNHYRKEGSSS